MLNMVDPNQAPHSWVTLFTSHVCPNTCLHRVNNVCIVYSLFTA